VAGNKWEIAVHLTNATGLLFYVPVCLLALQHTQKGSRSMQTQRACVDVCVCVSGVVSTPTASRCPYQQLMPSVHSSPIPITFLLLFLRHCVPPVHPTVLSHLYCLVSFFSPLFPTAQTLKPPTIIPTHIFILLHSPRCFVFGWGGGEGGEQWCVVRSSYHFTLTQYSDYQPLLLTRLSTLRTNILDCLLCFVHTMHNFIDRYRQDSYCTW
jgi:hypothetical protein